MKKVLKILSLIILTILIMTLILSYGIENTLVKTISETFTQKQISGHILDEVIKDNSDSDELLKLEKEIRSSQYINKITSKYLNNILNNVINNTDNKLDIKKELADIINKEMDTVSENRKQEIINEIDKIDFNQISMNVINNISRMDSLVLPILKIYSTMSNILFRIIILICILLIICINLIFTDNKIKELGRTGICCIISGIIVLLTILTVRFGTNFLSNRLLGRTADINLNLITILSLFDFIIGLVLIIIKKKTIKEK